MTLSRSFRAVRVATGIVMLTGCAASGFKYDPDALRKAVVFETRCPPEKVQIVEAMEAGTGHTKFRLDVCGQPQKWNRFGTSYFPEGKSPMGI